MDPQALAAQHKPKESPIVTRPVQAVHADCTQALNDLIDCLPLFTDAVERMRDYQPGYPPGGNGSRGSSGSSQPERLSGAAGKRYGADTAVRDEARLWQATPQLRDAARTIYAVLTTYGTRRTPIATLPDDPDSMWCRSCLRVNHHSPRRSAGGDLCRWCLEHRPDGWDMPPLAAAEAYSRGITVTATLMERAMKAEQPKESKKAKKARKKLKGHHAAMP